MRRAVGALGALALAATVACEAPSGPPEEEVRTLQWRAVALPVPGGVAGRIALRDVVACEGRWYTAGGMVAPDGETGPAVWTSPDALAWTPVPVAAESYYGVRALLYSAGCGQGRFAVLGGKPGGAHGNPRITQWYLPDRGPLVEVAAGFELYGGPKAVNVGRMAGGPGGWLIAGNRSAGAAVWTSADATGFQILEGVPPLASDQDLTTWAADVTAYRDGWIVVGGGLRPGRIDRDPVVWTSADGRRWQRAELPADEAYEEAQRVVAYRDGAVAAGIHGRSARAWRDDGEGWRVIGDFAQSTRDQAPAVHGLTVAGTELFAVVTDGAAYRLFSSADGGGRWREVPLPAAQPSGAGRALTVAAAGGRLVLLADDGQAATVWVATLG